MCNYFVPFWSNFFSYECVVINCSPLPSFLFQTISNSIFYLTVSKEMIDQESAHEETTPGPGYTPPISDCKRWELSNSLMDLLATPKCQFVVAVCFVLLPP